MSFFGWYVHVPVPSLKAPIRSLPGEAALEVARAELGKGEEGSNNSGPHLDRYRKGGVGGAWCAAFVSYCLEEGAALIAQPSPVKRSHGAKTLFERALKAGSSVWPPLPGDIVCWHRGAKGARTGHIGIVSRVEDGNSFFSIEGNKGSFPSRVREYLHELGEAGLLGFARLP